MIYDKGKVFLGLAIFLALVASPFWYNPVFGTGTSAPPEVPLPKDAKQCVLPKDQMRASHMQVIYDWRERVVREPLGGRIDRRDGREYQMSLSNTCLACHEGRAKFCDACHAYLAVKPFCWDCHFDPKEQV
jgi:hypothetical protein